MHSQQVFFLAAGRSQRRADICAARQGERNYIMQVVCEATQSPSSDVQVSAFACLVRIMHLYYDYMKFYMERALFGVRDLFPIGRVRFD